MKFLNLHTDLLRSVDYLGAEPIERATWLNRVMKQALASERYRATPQWVDAGKWLPQGPHEVLATDGEGWFIAYYKDAIWYSHELEESIDSEISHWMELPDPPEI